MIINLNNETYTVPQGTYRAILIEQIDARDTGKNYDLRFKWRIIYPCEDRKAYLVGKNYKLEPMTVLSSDLNSWFPAGLSQFETAPGQLDLSKLTGQQADLVIGHKTNDSHSLPFVYIRSIYPAGTLVKYPHCNKQ